MKSDNDYRFRGKDPVLDVLRTLIEFRANIDGISFKKVLSAIERESNYGITYTALKNWFYGKTRFPSYHKVVRVYKCLAMYCRRPVQLGDRKAYTTPRSVKRAA